MTGNSIIAIVGVTLYIIWLIIFILVIERRLRRLTERIFGITITREINRPVGKVELIDALFIFGWKVDGPAELGLRFTVGLLRIVFWLIAMLTPVVLGIVLYLKLGH